MKIMVVGGGGREHAIIKKLKESKNVTEIFALPGNGGIASDATCVPIGAKDIEKIRDMYGFANLPESLREMAIVRLEHPDTSLKDLGQYLTPPVGKSGVNHRLRKLGEIAEQIR